MSSPRSSHRRLAVYAAAVTMIVAVAIILLALGPVAAPPGAAQGRYRPLYDGPGDYVRGIFSGGIMRWVKVHIPEGYSPDAAVPLVLNYHGAGSNFHQQALLTGMSAKADKEGFIVVYPQASNWEAYWIPELQSPIDLDFTRDLLDHLERNLSIDPARVYATGFSSGGGMVDRLACSLSERIAAVGPVAGGYQYWQPCAPVRPVPIVFFHGTADPLALYTEVIRGQFYSIPDWAQAWAERNGCDPIPIFNFQEGDVYGETWENCSQGANVTLYAVKDGGHVWPGSRYGLALEYADATALMWDFFESHPMPQQVARSETDHSLGSYPEPVHARVDVGGYWLYITCQGRKRHDDNPTVILEAATGVEAREGQWGTLPGQIGEFTRVCMYDRAGIGWSDPSSIQPRTAQVVADELHALLQGLGEEGPVVLVAHSLGGYFSQLYVATYPQDVAGMVLIDALHEDLVEVLGDLLDAEESTYYGSTLLGAEIDVAASRSELERMRQGGETPLGDLPLVVIARSQPSSRGDLGVVEEEERRARWQELQRDLAGLSTNSTFVTVDESGHFIHFDQPELVVDAIRDVVEGGRR
jgi:polyhydroxybutyrate depolymerase